VGYYVLVVEHRKSDVSKLQIKWKGSRRVASVEFDYVFVVENLLTKELKAAHATRLRFYKDKDLNVTAELAQAAENNDHQLYVVSRILDARYNEQEMFHELLVPTSRGAVSGWRGHRGTLLSYGCGCSGDGGEFHGVSKRHIHGAQDAISLRVLIYPRRYSLWRRRQLL
jgi:hypothetical protein